MQTPLTMQLVNRCIVVLLWTVCVSGVYAQTDSERAAERILVLTDAQRIDGHAFRASLPTIHPNERDDGSTIIELYEDDRLLGPAETKHVDIIANGSGAFSHWGTALYFSASDNSDVRTNGKRYTVRYRADPPELMHLFEIPIDMMQPGQGQMWRFPLPPVLRGWPDDSQMAGSSRFLLLENGWPLLQAHSNHSEIREAGLGRYSHWDNTLYFSTSDNSDPTTNGRAYTIALAPSDDVHRFHDPWAPPPPIIEPSLPPLTVQLPADKSVIRSTRLAAQVADPNPRWLYYWEVDHAPTFDSPLIHRSPMISTSDQGVNPLQILQREITLAPTFELPYRVGMLAPLPDHPKARSQAVDILASRLAFGLDDEQRILSEVYAYVLSQIYRRDDSPSNNDPLITLQRDRGLCGSTNALAVDLLDSVGFAARLVQVRCPDRAALIQFGAGSHLSAEVFTNGQWSVFDPWFNFFLPDVSFRELAADHPDARRVSNVIHPRTISQVSPDLLPHNAGQVTLGDLAQSRTYFAPLYRYRVEGDDTPAEDQWFAAPRRLYPDPPVDIIWPQHLLTLFIRVRALEFDRSLLSHCFFSEPHPPQPKSIRATPWTTISVTIDLYDAYNAPVAARAVSASPPDAQE